MPTSSSNYSRLGILRRRLHVVATATSAKCWLAFSGAIDVAAWHEWARSECMFRGKLIAYCNTVICISFGLSKGRGLLTCRHNLYFYL